MKTTKRLLSFLLALAMLLTMASFPAFADEGEAEVGYQYKGKVILLEASMNGPDKWNGNNSEIRYIARPSTLNLYAGDKLVLPQSGLQLKITPATAKNAAGTTVTPTGFVIDVFQNYGHLDDTAPENLALVDGKTRFYFAYDASTKTITGIYKTAQEMAEGDPTKALDGIVLGKEGFWAVGMKYAIYHTSTEDVEFISYAANAYWDFNTNNFKTAPYMFFLDVEAAPTSADYEVSAPAVPAVTATTLTSGTDFKIYARTITGDTKTCVISEEKRTNLKNNATYNRLAGSMMGWELDFDAPAYLETVNISYYPKQFDYAVYGSLDGNNWYQIKGKTASAKNGNLSSNFALSVGGVAKYFRIEVVDVRETLWGTLYDTSTLGEVKGALNVFQGNKVTVTGDYNTELETDANGKAGFDFDNYPAGKEEGKYIYKIGDVDVTNKIADYIFAGATTVVTVTKYVAPAGPVVTFVGDKGSIEVETNGEGYYEVPAEYKGNYSFYEDAAFKTKLDTTLPVNGATTVYVKTIQWTAPAAKTVELKIKDTPTAATFGDSNNGPFVAPRETIYVGDTLIVSNDEYKNVDSGIAGAVEISRLDIYGRRYSTKDGDNGKINEIDAWGVANLSYTFKKAGIYTFYVEGIYTKDASGTETRNGTKKSYSCVFVVKERPTSAPEAAVAPTYTGAKKDVVALLDTTNGTAIDNTSIAFREAYCGTNVSNVSRVVAVNATMSSSSTPASTLHIQFNLGSLSYVDNITITAKNYSGHPAYPIYDYDVYGSDSDDGDDWYFLNSGISTNGKYSVNGVAKRIRIVPRQTDGGYAIITAYTVNGYAISEDAVSATSNPTWLKDGVKVELASEKDLPVAYTSGDKTYAITGWKVDTGAGLNEVSLALIAERNFKQLGTLVPVVTEIPVKEASLTGTLAPAGQDIVDGKTFSGKYINGFYVEGTQIRLPEGEGATYVDGGLRFVNILDNSLITELDELRTAEKVRSYEFGTLALASTRYTGGDLVIGYNNYTKKVPGEKIFARADNFKDAYFKYTVCVTGIGPTNYTKDVIVRPYITIELADETTVTLYGQQYQTSLYAAAEFALAKDPNLTSEERVHLEGIVNAVK